MVCDDVGSSFSYSLMVPSDGALQDISIIIFYYGTNSGHPFVCEFQSSRNIVCIV